MGCRFGVHLRNRYACSKVPLAAQSRSAGLRMPGVVNECRKVWQLAGFAIPEATTARRTSFLTIEPSRWWRPCCPRPSLTPPPDLWHAGRCQGVITTGTRRFTLARTTALRSPGSTPPSRFRPPMLQPDQGLGLVHLKVAVHGISAFLVQTLQAVCLRVNKDADGAGNAYGNPP